MSDGRAFRLLIGVVLLVVFQLFGGFVHWMEGTPSEIVELQYINEDVPNKVREYISSGYKNKYKLRLSNDEESLIVFNSGDEDSREGFTNTTIGTSRMTLAFPQDMVYSDRDGCFHKFDNGRNGYFVTDAYSVVNAFIKSEAGTVKLKDLGYNTNVKEMTLAIPDNGYIYKKDIIDSYIYILANGKEITKDNAVAIWNSLKTLMSKATILHDYGIILDDEKYFGIMPEFMFKEIRNTNTWWVVYYNNCNYTNLSMYTSDKLDDTIENELINYFKNTTDIFKSTGFYGKASQTMGDAQAYAATNISLVNKQDNFEELFGENYWLQF